MSKFLISFFFLGALFSSTHAEAAGIHRGGAELLNAKAYSIYFDSSLFVTKSHIDETGTETALADGAGYHFIDADFKISYGLSSNLEASVFGKFRSVSSTDGTTTVSKTGPESLGVEAKYSFSPIGKMKYAIGARYRQTLYTNTKYATVLDLPANEIILGDDGSEYGVDLYMTYTSNPWKLDLMAGYNSPPNNLSSEIIYNAQARYRFTQFAMAAGVDGIYSLKRDPALVKPFVATGQTALWNSYNREKMVPYLGADYAFEKFLLAVKGGTVVSGRSTDKGSYFLASVSWSSEGVTPESVKVESFKEYHIDGSVLKVSARGNFIKIDQGLSTDVEKGMKFDIYQTDYFGGNVLVASGVVYEVGADWAVIKLTKKYKEIEIKPGFAARGY